MHSAQELSRTWSWKQCHVPKCCAGFTLLKCLLSTLPPFCTKHPHLEDPNSQMLEVNWLINWLPLERNNLFAAQRTQDMRARNSCLSGRWITAASIISKKMQTPNGDNLVGCDFSGKNAMEGSSRRPFAKALSRFGITLQAYTHRSGSTAQGGSNGVLVFVVQWLSGPSTTKNAVLKLQEQPLISVITTLQS